MSEQITVSKDFVLALAEAIYVRYEILSHLAHKKGGKVQPSQSELDEAMSRMKDEAGKQILQRYGITTVVFCKEPQP